MHSIIIDNKIIEFQLYRVKRRGIGLKITYEEGLKVYSPIYAKDSDIKEALTEKANWILKKLEKVKNAKKHVFSLAEGSVFYFQGKELKIDIVNTQEKDLIQVEIIDGKLILTYNKDISLDKLKLFIMNWCTERALNSIKESIEYYRKIIGVSPKKVRLKTMKSLWGSCSSSDSISLDWRIILAPKDVLNYLIVHELAHMRERNHSKNYWKLVETIMPSYKIQNKWLKDNGMMLKHYFI